MICASRPSIIQLSYNLVIEYFLSKLQNLKWEELRFHIFVSKSKFTVIDLFERFKLLSIILSDVTDEVFINTVVSRPSVVFYPVIDTIKLDHVQITVLMNEILFEFTSDFY